MRRGLGIAAVTAALGVAVSACGTSEGGVVELRFSWWGADDRHATTQKVIERFEKENPNIRVSGEYTDWDGYWDRLATNAAANDAPDIITLEERYVREYAERGALLDLKEVSEQLDTSKLDKLVMGSGRIDGGLYTVPSGVNAFTIMADPQAFEEAGVEMPDDDAWTWEDYVDTAIEISEATDGKVHGTQTFAFNETSFQVFARQRGQALYDEQGKLGFDATTMQKWWEHARRLHEEGGAPSAAESVELEAGGPDQSVLATHSGAMATFWTNQLGAMTETSGRDIKLLRFPGETANDRTGLFYKPAMSYSISAESEHPEEAAKFVDFLVNDVKAAELIKADRGLPANTEVREQILDQLPEADAKSAEFLDRIEPSIEDSVPPPPIGAGEVVDITARVNEDLMFGDLSPKEAADQWMSEVNEATGDQ